MNSFHHHPGDEQLERYSLGQLSPDEVDAVEDHLLVCVRCRNRLNALETFLSAFRAASEKAGPVTFTHETDDGPVHLQILCVGGDFWVGKFWGAELEGRQVFLTSQEAWDYVRRSFEEMFPGHVCTARCGLQD